MLHFKAGGLLSPTNWGEKNFSDQKKKKITMTFTTRRNETCASMMVRLQIQ